jgi:hypothetical protein
MVRLPFYKALGTPHGLGAAINRDESSGNKCYASNCMMWQRYNDPQIGEPTSKGYCGLIKIK